ncbi:hypothetical protein [Nonomuraea phyllanthi]|uniref:hypothetical protein n=1 Tax=Nonomuraea phyllanthi TaxID=2219224 RepID=UPI0018859D61|nr:hypothetical protein [Nonomuraea phyllanthi]
MPLDRLFTPIEQRRGLQALGCPDGREQLVGAPPVAPGALGGVRRVGVAEGEQGAGVLQPLPRPVGEPSSARCPPVAFLEGGRRAVVDDGLLALAADEEQPIRREASPPGRRQAGVSLLK